MRETDRVENVVERDGNLDFDGRLVGADRSCGPIVVAQKELLEAMLSGPVTGEVELRCAQCSGRLDTVAVAPQYLCFQQK